MSTATVAISDNGAAVGNTSPPQYCEYHELCRDQLRDWSDLTGSAFTWTDYGSAGDNIWAIQPGLASWYDSSLATGSTGPWDINFRSGSTVIQGVQKGSIALLAQNYDYFYNPNVDALYVYWNDSAGNNPGAAFDEILFGGGFEDWNNGGLRLGWGGHFLITDNYVDVSAFSHFVIVVRKCRLRQYHETMGRVMPFLSFTDPETSNDSGTHDRNYFLFHRNQDSTLTNIYGHHYFSQFAYEGATVDSHASGVVGMSTFASVDYTSSVATSPDNIYRSNAIVPFPTFGAKYLRIGFFNYLTKSAYSALGTDTNSIDGVDELGVSLIR